jgi:hypothetical protein
LTRISEEDRQLFEKSIFLPMVLTILNRDIELIKVTPFKLKKPYIALVDDSMKRVQKDLYQTKQQMNKKKMKLFEVGRDEAFTQFLFVIDRWEEQHNYFNPRIRNEVQQLLQKYLLHE